MYQKPLTKLPGKVIAKIIESNLKPEMKAEKLYGVYSRLNKKKKDQLEYEFDILYMESTFLTFDDSLVEVKPTPTNNQYSLAKKIVDTFRILEEKYKFPFGKNLKKVE